MWGTGEHNPVAALLNGFLTNFWGTHSVGQPAWHEKPKPCPRVGTGFVATWHGARK